MTKVRQLSFDDVVSGAMEIYSKSFPPNETRPVKETLKMMRERDYRLYVIEDDGGAVAGMALVYVWDGFALLDCMAVSGDRRGKGLGSQLFRRVSKLLEGRVLLFEIETPSLGEQAARRERFCRALGATTISDTYVMPSYEGMEPEVMLLMGVSTSGGDVDYTDGMLQDAVKTIYADVYDRHRPDLVSDSLIGMPGRVCLPPVA